MSAEAVADLAEGPAPDGVGRVERERPPERWVGRPLAETRWLLELSRLMVAPVFAGGGIPRGDGRPVVLMPGFLAGDQTLVVMASWLYRIGYRPRLCGFIANVDCSDRAVERLEPKLERLADRHGRRVALIGHSRGGHYARALAARRPDLVSHAISMGADLQGMFGCSRPTLAAAAGARAVLKRTGRARMSECLSDICRCPFATDFHAPFPVHDVRMTSIYSKGDGVVDWHTQRVPYADCVEVTGSHVGLIFNRRSYLAIAAALAAPELRTEPIPKLPESRRAR
jgi:pimeloyl-ACP methyl ester carboxylesterase